MNDDVYEFMIRFEIDDLRVLSWPSLNHSVNISSISQFNSTIPIVTAITFLNGVGNDVITSMTSLDFTRFIYLKEINIKSNALNRVSAFIATNLTQLIAINVDGGSLTNIQKYVNER